MVIRICAFIAAIGLGSLGWAQPSARPLFEVASVKLDPSCRAGRRPGDGPSPGGLNLVCAPLRRLLQLAYGTFAHGPQITPVHLQLIGGPPWMDSEQFDIRAKAQGDLPMDQIYGPMLQVLLEDCFHLKLHGEIRELPSLQPDGGERRDQKFHQ